MRFVFIVLLVVQSCALFAQGNSKFFKKISKERAEEVVDLFFNTIKKRHTNIYYYASQQEVESRWKAIKEQCRDSMTVNDLYVLFARTNYLFDYHTGIDKYCFKERALNDTVFVFPAIYVQNQRVYLQSIGMEIYSINGIQVDSILNDLLQYIAPDHSMDYIEGVLSVSDLFLSMLHDLGISSPYWVNGRMDNQDTLLVVKGVCVKDWKSSYSTYNDYSFEIFPDEKIAIIWYDAMFYNPEKPRWYPKANADFIRFFNECHEKGIEHIFIDVSRNNGGWMPKLDNFLYHYFKVNPDSSYQLTGVRRRKIGGLRPDRVFIKGRQVKSVKGVEPFAGKVWIYQSVFSNSATPMFCACMKLLCNATLVGEATGQALPLHSRAKYFDLYFDVDMKRGGFPQFRVARNRWTDEYPCLPRSADGGRLLPDIEYPMLFDRRFDIEDCKKIIELYSKK